MCDLKVHILLLYRIEAEVTFTLSVQYMQSFLAMEWRKKHEEERCMSVGTWKDTINRGKGLKRKDSPSKEKFLGWDLSSDFCIVYWSLGRNKQGLYWEMNSRRLEIDVRIIFCNASQNISVKTWKSILQISKPLKIELLKDLLKSNDVLGKLKVMWWIN